MISSQLTEIVLRYALFAVLILVTFVLTIPALAEVPKHAPADQTGHTMEQPADHAGHQATEQMQHGEPPMAHEATADQAHSMDHSGHAMQEEGHVHPSADAAPPESVGLDEQLGTHIPLDLTFRDEDGNPVRLGDLINKPTVIAPIYYRCPNVCHFLQGDLARVLPQLKLAAGEDYQVLSISFDETETPELAKRSRDTYYTAMADGYPTGAWRFLTGDLHAIQALTDAAGYKFQRVGTEFLHPVAFFIVAPDGMIVRYLHGTHVLAKDLTLALYEAKEGRIGTTIRKVVQYCFSFDPEQKTYVFNILRVSATAILVTLGLFLAFLVLGGKKSKKGSKS